MNKPLNKKQIVDMDKLKDGDRIKFGDNSFGQITNYEIDISNLKGTIKRDKYIKEDKDFIAVKCVCLLDGRVRISRKVIQRNVEKIMAKVIAKFGKYKFTGTHSEFRKVLKSLQRLDSYSEIPRHLQDLPPDSLITLFELFKPKV
jgi:hypothetical protein